MKGIEKELKACFATLAYTILNGMVDVGTDRDPASGTIYVIKCRVVGQGGITVELLDEEDVYHSLPLDDVVFTGELVP